MGKRLGLGARALIGFLGGAAEGVVEQIDQDGKDIRERALLDFKQKHALKLEQLRSDNNFKLEKMRQGSADTRHQATMNQNVELAGIAEKGHRYRHAETVGLAKQRNQIAAAEAAAAAQYRGAEALANAKARSEAAKARAAEAKAAGNYRGQMLELRKAAIAAKTARDNSQNTKQREYWKRQEKRLDQQAKDAERRFDLTMRRMDKQDKDDERRHQAEMRREVFSTTTDRQGNLIVAYHDGRVKRINAADMGAGGMTWAEAYEIAKDEMSAKAGWFSTDEKDFSGTTREKATTERALEIFNRGHRQGLSKRYPQQPGSAGSKPDPLGIRSGTFYPG